MILADTNNEMNGNKMVKLFIILFMLKGRRALYVIYICIHVLVNMSLAV